MPSRVVPKTARRELDTETKVRFYSAMDARGTKSVAQVCREQDVSRSTGYEWIRKRQRLGEDVAIRRLRIRSDKLGRPHNLSKEDVEKLISSDNPVRDQPYKVQFAHFGLKTSRSGIKRAFKKYGLERPEGFTPSNRLSKDPNKVHGRAAANPAAKPVTMPCPTCGCSVDHSASEQPAPT